MSSQGSTSPTMAETEFGNYEKGWVTRMIAMPTRVSSTAHASSGRVGFR